MTSRRTWSGDALSQVPVVQRLRRRRSRIFRPARPIRSPRPDPLTRLQPSSRADFALDLGQIVAAPTLADDFGQVAGDPVSGAVDLGSVGLAAHPIMVAIETGANQDLGAIASAVTLSDDFGAIVDAVVNSYSLGTVP